MKKIISVIICAVMLLSVLPFNAFAAKEINFAVRISKETDNELELVLDFDGGTGFSALDIDIDYDRVKLSLKTCKKGTGYEAFEKYLSEKNALSICSINVNHNPVKVSMANVLEYKNIGGKKSVLILNFAKAQGEKFEKDDVTFDFTNCQTSSFEDIKVNLAYDLKTPAATSASNTEISTQYPQQSSADNIEGEPEGEIGGEVQGESQSQDASGNDGTPSTDENENQPASKTTAIVLIVAGVVVVVGAAALILFKSKKKPESEDKD